MLYLTQEQREKFEVLFTIALDYCYNLAAQKHPKAKEVWATLGMIRIDLLGEKDEEAAKNMRSLIEKGLKTNDTEAPKNPTGNDNPLPGKQEGTKEKPV